MSYVSWPEWVPAPQESSWGFQPEDLRSTTETEVGAIIRPQFDSDILIADCTLVCNRMQSAWFESFEKASVQEGFWFTMPVWYGGELRDGVCMIKDRPKWSVEAYTTTYKFSILVQKRSLEMDQCLLDLLECWSPCETTFIATLSDEDVEELNHTTDTGEI